MSRVTFGSNEIYSGQAYHEGAFGGKRGVPRTHLVAVQFAAETTDADGIGVNLTATAAALLMSDATGVLVDDGVATFTVPGNVSITSTANNSTRAFNLHGYDQYGVRVSEQITGPNNTTVYGKKGFKTIDIISVNGAITGNVDIGRGTGLTLPYKIDSTSDVVVISLAGVYKGGTIVAGLTASDASSATTADVRGLITPTAALAGGLYTVLMVVSDSSTREAVYGNDQFASA